MVDILQQKKEELAVSYLKELKTELWASQWGAVDLLASRLTTRMTSETALGDKIDDLELTDDEKKLVAASPTTAETIFSFIKDKQEKLAAATTVEELDQLKKELPTTITTEKATGYSSATGIVEGTAIWGAELGLTVATVKKIDAMKTASKIKSIELKDPAGFAEKMKSQFTSIAEKLEESTKNPKLVPTQRANIMKSVKQLEIVAGEMDEGTMTSIQMLSTLKDKLPVSILKSIKSAEAEKLWKLDDAFRETFRNAKAWEEITLLEKQGIKGLSNEVVTALKSASSIEEVKAMTVVMRSQKGILWFLDGMKAVLFVDVIATWINIWMLSGELDEAEEYKKLNKLRGEIKKERAWVTFGTSTALMALETIWLFAAFGSSLGPIWTLVWLGLWAITYAITEAVNIYYDKVEFYSQNEEEFKSEYRTEIKQAIISSAASEEWDLNTSARLTAAEKKAGEWRGSRTLKNGISAMTYGLISPTIEKAELNTTEDARKALIWQEEYIKTDYPFIQQGFASGKTEDEFKKTLSAEDLATYEKEKTAINAVIDSRMAYITNFMYKNKTSKEYISFVSAMKNNMGIKMIEKILADSKVYHDMQQTWADQYITGCTTIDTYKTTYKEKLQTDNGTRFTTCEKIWTDDQYKFMELYYGVKNYETYAFDQDKKDPNYIYKDKVTEMQARIDFIKHYYEYKTLGVSLEDHKKMTLYPPVIDLNQIKEMIVSGKLDADILNLNALNAKDYFMSTEYLDRMKSDIEVSDSVGQNIIYRIAVEFHGYTGDNEMTNLMAFFKEEKWSALGLYYTNKWIINNDYAVDKSINIDEFETMTTDEILKEWMGPSKWNLIFAAATSWWMASDPFGFMNGASMIDTKADAGDMDDKMNIEYRTELKTIITEEKWCTIPANKKIVEQSVIDYIKANSVQVGKTITYDETTGEKTESDDKEQWYVEIPYYLIIQAKKAGIGDLRKFIFKYENEKITACTSKLYLTEKLDFTQTGTTIQKEYLSWARESLDESTQKYVDYVDTVKNQFEKLISYDGDELDIPKEYLKTYRAEITKRETFKASLLTLDTDTAKSELAENYQTYHDYFENTYIAMLSKISSFSSSVTSSNDLDSSTYLQQVETISAKLKTITVEKGVLKWPIELMTETQRKVFAATLQSKKIDGKTITELAKSAKATDQAKAIWGAKQIFKSILEAEILTIDEKENITHIGHWENLLPVPSEVTDAMNLKLLVPTMNEQLIAAASSKRLAKNITDDTFFDSTKYSPGGEAIDYDKIEIKSLTTDQEKTTTKTNEVQKIIEATRPNLAYPGRWLVTFDPETNLLTSRSKSTKIDSTTLKIDGLNIVFATLQELILATDFINEIKYKYHWVKDFYFGSRLWLGVDYGIYRSESWLDTQILTLAAIKREFPSVLDSNNDVKDSFIALLNTT